MAHIHNMYYLKADFRGYLMVQKIYRLFNCVYGQTVSLNIHFFSYIFLTRISRLIFHISSGNFEYIFMALIQKNRVSEFFFIQVLVFILCNLEKKNKKNISKGYPLFDIK